MSNLKVLLDNKELNLSQTKEGNVEIVSINVSITVEDGSFLHIGAAPSPLTEKKGSVFKVDRTPVIPATSFKGALRNQMELLLIKEKDNLKTLFAILDDNLIKPCIPAPNPAKSEQELFSFGYRGKIEDKKYTGHCEIQVDENNVNISELGICPVCYFMGATGIMGFLRFSNYYPGEGDWLVDQTNIRIDRKTNTAAQRAKVDGEQVKPNTKFAGTIEIINKTPQGFEFGQPRKIGEKTIDPWLEKWTEQDINNRKKTLIEKILFPAIQNIKLLGGQKSRGAGKVKVEIRNT
ncbi:RAMP superfamily CRISPR-associated protein [Caldisericum sp.]|uniref:RAMP superfamily CRISPR-associated protein n=1 Tax=Caldisericum sp. TaxID=2499687 RepID=UPI003D0EC3F1